MIYLAIETWHIIVVVIVVILIYAMKIKRDKDNRIKDTSVEPSVVIEELKEFKVELNSRLKYGYTEKSIQNQLKKYLQTRFVHVKDEYGLEGVNATKIDLDVGNGKVGIELKLAKALFKTTNLHRLVGQIDEYIKAKYEDGNLIVIVFGEKEHTQERVMLDRIKDKVVEKNATYLYVEIPI